MRKPPTGGSVGSMPVVRGRRAGAHRGMTLTPRRHGFSYIWEYRIRDDALVAFLSAYGPNGDWVRLFRAHEGYRGSELLRDASDPLRFVTIDHWRSRADFEAFRSAAADAFAALDRACTELTTSERHLGDFERADPHAAGR